MAFMYKFDGKVGLAEMDSIRETEEGKISRELEKALGSGDFNGITFAKSLQSWHPTLQQDFYRLMQACVAWFADENTHYIDGRNRASHEGAKEIEKIMSGQAVPFI